MESLFEQVLQVQPDVRRLILADRTAAQMKGAYALLRENVAAAPTCLSIFHPASTATILEKRTRAENLTTRGKEPTRPQTVTSSYRRMLNWLWTLFNDQRSLLSKITKEVIKQRTLTPTKKGKPSVDIRTLIQFLSNYETTSFIDLRNKAILLYVLASGRRPSNAVCAMTPLQEDVFEGRGIAFTEFKSKNDGSRIGNVNFVTSASNEKIDPIGCFLSFFRTVEFQELLDDYRAQNPNVRVDMIPLFLYRVSRGTNNGQVRPLTADSVSNIIAKWFELAEIKTDKLRRKVHPKHIRNTQNARMKIAQVPEVIRKLTCAWALTDVADQYYFSDDGRPKQLTDFLLTISEDPGIRIGMDPVEALNNWITPESCTTAESNRREQNSVVRLPTKLITKIPNECGNFLSTKRVEAEPLTPTDPSPTSNTTSLLIFSTTTKESDAVG